MKYYYTHNCGELVKIDSKEYPDFFLWPDEENKKLVLAASCPKCSDTITIIRDNIGNSVVPSPSGGRPHPPVKVKWHYWEANSKKEE